MMKEAVIHPAMWDGRDVPTPAVLYGHFAVHHNLNPLSKYPWSLTHVASGLKVADVRTKRAGVTLARRLTALPLPWERQNPIAGVPAAVNARAKAIAQRADMRRKDATA